MNKVNLVGRLTKDPQTRSTQNGKSAAVFTVACRNAFKPKGADFVPCVAWGKAGEIITKYTAKGDLIGVSGNFSTRTYEAQDGSKRFVAECNVNEIDLLESKKTTKKKEEPAEEEQCFEMNSFFEEEDDDDVPF